MAILFGLWFVIHHGHVAVRSSPATYGLSWQHSARFCREATLRIFDPALLRVLAKHRKVTRQRAKVEVNL
jgi:hypothetical protein